MTNEERLIDLQNKLAASLSGGQGLAKRITAIRVAIADLEALISSETPPEAPTV